MIKLLEGLIGSNQQEEKMIKIKGGIKASADQIAKCACSCSELSSAAVFQYGYVNFGCACACGIWTSEAECESAFLQLP